MIKAVGAERPRLYCCYKAYEIPDMKIFRFASSLYYANASHFVNKLYKLTGCNPEHINEKRARCERRQAEAGRQRKNPLCGVLRRRKRLNLTADKDGRTFSVILSTLSVTCCVC